jgi:hypothetical protein
LGLCGGGYTGHRTDLCFVCNLSLSGKSVGEKIISQLESKHKAHIHGTRKIVQYANAQICSSGFVQKALSEEITCQESVGAGSKATGEPGALSRRVWAE